MDDGVHFQVFSLHSVALIYWCYTHNVREAVMHEKLKESLREKFKSCIFSHLRTPGQLLHEVGVLVKLLFLEFYKNCQMQLPKRNGQECGERQGFRSCSVI